MVVEGSPANMTADISAYKEKASHDHFKLNHIWTCMMALLVWFSVLDRDGVNISAP